MLNEFKAFLLRGHVVDLAVAVAVGAAFAAVINSMVKDIITPLVSFLFGQPTFANMSLDINGSVFAYGNFLNALLSFVIISFVVFFFVVKPYHKLIEITKSDKIIDDDKSAEVLLLEEIRDLLKKK